MLFEAIMEWIFLELKYAFSYLHNSISDVYWENVYGMEDEN